MSRPDTTLERWTYVVPRREFYLVSAPMTGEKDLNIPVIRQVIARLARTGIVAFNPFAHEDPAELVKQDSHYFTSQYLPLVPHPRCTGVIVLPGWMCSDGSTTEVVMASRFDKPVFVYRVAIDPNDGTAHPHLQTLQREEIAV